MSGGINSLTLKRDPPLTKTPIEARALGVPLKRSPPSDAMMSGCVGVCRPEKQRQ